MDDTFRIQASPDQRGVRMQRRDGTMMEFTRRTPFTVDEINRFKTLPEIVKWADGSVLFNAEKLNHELKSFGLSDEIGEFGGHFQKEVDMDLDGRGLLEGKD